MKDQASKLRQILGKESVPIKNNDHPTADQPCTAKVIAVTSGKGGVGKTTLAVNIALLLAELPARVLIVDADLGLANVDVMLGIEHGRHIGHLLLDGSSAADIASDGPTGIKVISGGSGLRELADASSEQRGSLLHRLRAYYNEFDFVVVDTSPGISTNVLDFLRDADAVLLVTTSEPTSLRDAYAAFKTITGEMPETEITTVVNSAGAAQAKGAIDTLNTVAGKFLNRRCERWHRIDPDSMVSRAVMERRPLVSTYPRSPAAIGLRQLAHVLSQ